MKNKPWDKTYAPEVIPEVTQGPSLKDHGSPKSRLAFRPEGATFQVIVTNPNPHSSSH